MFLWWILPDDICGVLDDSCDMLDSISDIPIEVFAQ